MWIQYFWETWTNLTICVWVVFYSQQDALCVTHFISGTFQIVFHICFKLVVWGSSVSILSDCTTRVWFLAEAKDFSCSLCIQASSLAYPASYPMGTGDPMLGVKSSWGIILTTNPSSSMDVKNEQELHILPPWCLHGSSGTAFCQIVRLS
jgi:hypothetical protein